jgi:redox-sensitive bicupin YhaK (pirin superfamily)
MQLLIQAKRKSLGGFEVGRVLPFIERRAIGPFVFFDHMGPTSFPPQIPHDADVRPHPHIGLSTITYLLNGEVTHRDSLDVEQVIRPGEVNWMTAGRGISHSERFDGMRSAGGMMDGAQAWVALPEPDEETEPEFHHHDRDVLPAWSEAGLDARLIVGDAFGETSPVRTFSPLFYIHARLEPGARAVLPSGHSERAAYVARGSVEHEGRQYRHGDMLVFAKAEESPSVQALERSHVLLLGGEPLGPRHLWWNFVSSRKERIDQAKADWRAGRFTLPGRDNGEFIPLPPEPPPPAPNPMS